GRNGEEKHWSLLVLAGVRGRGVVRIERQRDAIRPVPPSFGPTFHAPTERARVGREQRWIGTVAVVLREPGRRRSLFRCGLGCGAATTEAQRQRHERRAL